MYDIKIHPHKLHFKQPAGTSRGTYVTRDVWYLHLTSDMYPDRIGIGECAPLPKLSCDDIPDYESVLSRICNRVAAEGTFSVEELREYPLWTRNCYPSSGGREFCTLEYAFFTWRSWNSY